MAYMRKHGHGFTLIEVLVTIVILAGGLLGLAALQMRLQQSEFEAYQRNQALTLLYDMVERMNLNRQTAQCYAFTAAGGAPYLGTDGTDRLTTPSCTAYGSVSTQALAVNDLTTWDGFLRGSSETLSGNAIGAMVGARGCVSFDPTANTYTIAVAWQGITETAAPTVDCANDLYGTETRRRVVWTKLQVASLL